jgi:D-alanine-D-alanine ligase-like ATP-grasp enzyme
LPECNLYTKLFTGPQVREYRVYIVNGKAVDTIEKRRKGRQWYRDHNLDRESPYTTYVRSHKNGWAFARNTSDATPEEISYIEAWAERAAEALQLGWGGVDMIVSRVEGEHVEAAGELSDVRVVETNTSIGIYQAPRTTEVLGEALAAYFEYERQEAA